MERLFGTDGIRSVAGTFPLDKRSIPVLGAALAEMLTEEGFESPPVLVGRDTRESGTWIEKSVFLGLRWAGARPVSAGVIPTSALSLLAKKDGFSAGIVISASHNPYQDNGIKIFSREGFKISDAWETRLQKAVLDTGRSIPETPLRIRPAGRYRREYEEFLAARLRGVRFARKMKLVLDCANGAGFAIAPEVMRSLGCDVIAINDAPDGKNINRDCGSLHPHGLMRAVAETKADLGIAYDGDADRAVWVDDKGRILNGDHTLYVLAGFMKAAGRLSSDAVVATTMSNMGLETALEKMGLKLARTNVGDKYVLERMLRLGANLGGERSGHTILLDECPTGDGILTSIKLLEAMGESGLSLSRLAEGLKEFPQILLSVPVKKKTEFGRIPEVARAIAQVRDRLKDSGRLEVRYSGTELLARVMVESPNLEITQACARRIADAIERQLGN